MRDKRQPQEGRSLDAKCLLVPGLQGDIQMSSRAFANLIGVSLADLATMRRHGTGPKCGKWGCWRVYRPQALIDWLNSRAAFEAEVRYDA